LVSGLLSAKDFRQKIFPCEIFFTRKNRAQKILKLEKSGPEIFQAQKFPAKKFHARKKVRPDPAFAEKPARRSAGNCGAGPRFRNYTMPSADL